MERKRRDEMGNEGIGGYERGMKESREKEKWQGLSRIRKVAPLFLEFLDPTGLSSCSFSLF